MISLEWGATNKDTANLHHLLGSSHIIMTFVIGSITVTYTFSLVIVLVRMVDMSSYRITLHDLFAKSLGELNRY
jgi:hypothetical protein